MGGREMNLHTPGTSTVGKEPHHFILGWAFFMGLPLMTSANNSTHQDVRPVYSILIRWPVDEIVMIMSCPIVRLLFV